MPRISETRESLSSTYATQAGANIPRTLAKLRAGEAVTIGVLGDSKMDPGTAGNAAGTAVDLLVDAIGAWSDSAITVVNEADSGDTMAVQFLGGCVAAVAASAPDLVVIEIGTNDSNADANGVYAAGYVKAASWAAVERACAYVRDASEPCEFVFVATTPYVPGSSSNPKILEYNAGIRALAPVVGAEFVDGYAAFTDYGADWSPLLLDSTHRNAAGNAVLADAITLHFPETGPLTAPALAPRPTSGKYGIDLVDKDSGTFLGGYRQVNSAAVAADYTYALTGAGWSVDGAYDVNSTPGDSWTLSSPRALEFLVSIDIASVAVVDVHVDDVLVAEDVNLNTQSGKNGTTYWLAPVVGLDGGDHSLKLTVKSGTLRLQTSAVLLAVPAGGYVPGVKVVSIHGAAATTTMTTSYQDIVPDAVIDLPSGWTSMDVEFSGHIVARCSGAMTAIRRLDWGIRVGGANVSGIRQANLSQQAATYIFGQMTLAGVHVGATGSITVDAVAKVDDATDTIQTTSAYLWARLTRTA